jgi:hypothetical protein
MRAVKEIVPEALAATLPVTLQRIFVTNRS